MLQHNVITNEQYFYHFTFLDKSILFEEYSLWDSGKQHIIVL